MPSVACSIGTRRPVSPSRRLRDAAGRRRHDGGLARHRLEVDDAERLVDRRADERRWRPTAARPPSARGSISRSRPPRRVSARARRRGPRPRPGSSACPARRRQHQLDLGRQLGARAQEQREPLLPGDPVDEHHDGVRVDAVRADPVGVVDGRPVSVSIPLCTTWTLSGSTSGYAWARRRASPPTAITRDAPRYDVRSAKDRQAHPPRAARPSSAAAARIEWPVTTCGMPFSRPPRSPPRFAYQVWSPPGPCRTAARDRGVDRERLERRFASTSSGRSAYAVTPGSSRGSPNACTRTSSSADRAAPAGLATAHPGPVVDGRRVLLGQDVDAHGSDATVTVAVEAGAGRVDTVSSAGWFRLGRRAPSSTTGFETIAQSRCSTTEWA